MFRIHVIIKTATNLRDLRPNELRWIMGAASVHQQRASLAFQINQLKGSSSDLAFQHVNALEKFLHGKSPRISAVQQACNMLKPAS